MVKGEMRSGKRKKKKHKIMLKKRWSSQLFCCMREVPHRVTKWTDQSCKCRIIKKLPSLGHTTGLTSGDAREPDTEH